MQSHRKRHDSGEITRPIPVEELRLALELDAAHHLQERPTLPSIDDPEDAFELEFVALGDLL